jgi:exodeoxyribonuclease VII small subunit
LADTPDFERSLSELESLVERLERGDLPLEDALKTFERGVELTRLCQNSLKAAQQKVEILLKRGGQSGIESFTAPDEGAGQA